MKQTSETIVFFGSGPVAAASLALLARDFEIEAVVTKPQPAHHKAPFPVLALARELGLKIFTASDQAELGTLFATASGGADQAGVAAHAQSFRSRLGVIIDHGIIMPQAVIDYFPLGIVNSHFSLLPKWRGADPISFAILGGDAETGVSLMTIVARMDEGPLLAQHSLPLDPEVTTPRLTTQLIDLSHQLLVETLPRYIAGEITPSPQPTDTVVPTYSRKLTKADSRLDWTKPAAQLEREIRAYAEWPRSRTTLGSTDVVITKAHVLEEAAGNQPGSAPVAMPTDDSVQPVSGLFPDQGQDQAHGYGSSPSQPQPQPQPGTLWRPAKNQLGVHTTDGIFVIDRLIPAGKKEMPITAFLAGHSV